jgi:magnesium transporter
MSNSSLDLKNMLSNLDESGLVGFRSILDEYYPQDIAEEYDSLDEKEKLLLFDVLSEEQGAEVLVELEEDEILTLLNIFADEKITRLTNKMELDDAADILAYLDDERMLKILENIQRPIELRELLSYEPDTCGGIMTPSFISIRADLKIAAALRYVRLKAKESSNQMVYIYVTKRFGELAGVISIRQLFMADDKSTVGEHMSEETISVKVHDDQELAANLISKYRFLAIPVVNNNNQLVGIITIDDVVDVIEEEATEDIYQSSGINVSDAMSGDSSFVKAHVQAYKSRTPWLIITLFGQYISATVIAKFDTTVAAMPIAISFMPLLAGLAGNIGTQSSTIMVRGISLGQIDTDRSIKLFLNEIITGFFIGLTCALITAAVSFIVYNNYLLSILIAVSLLASMILSVGLATLIPIVFKKMNIDPAVASGPLITTLNDVISFFVYLSLITYFILHRG